MQAVPSFEVKQLFVASVSSSAWRSNNQDHIFSTSRHALHSDASITMRQIIAKVATTSRSLPRPQKNGPSCDHGKGPAVEDITMVEKRRLNEPICPCHRHDSLCVDVHSFMYIHWKVTTEVFPLSLYSKSKSMFPTSSIQSFTEAMNYLLKRLQTWYPRNVLYARLCNS